MTHGLRSLFIATQMWVPSGLCAGCFDCAEPPGPMGSHYTVANSAFEDGVGAIGLCRLTHGIGG